MTLLNVTEGKVSLGFPSDSEYLQDSMTNDNYSSETRIEWITLITYILYAVLCVLRDNSCHSSWKRGSG